MRYQQYSIGALLTVTAIAAVLLSEPLTFLFFSVLVEMAVIITATELLYHSVPPRLLASSEDNCVRMDGTWSEQRAENERRARRKVRKDLLAVLLLVALPGNWLVILLHSEIIPLPVAIQAAGSFDLDSDAWKQQLRDQRVDAAYEQWSHSKALLNHDEIRSRQVTLWRAWPLIMIVGLVWLISSWAFLRYAYPKILREFQAGIASRQEKYIVRDITRLQS